MDVDPFVAMKHLLLMHGRLRVQHQGIRFPADHLQISRAAIDLAQLLPVNRLVIAELFITGLVDRDPDDNHYCCRALLHTSNPAIGIPLSYALSFDPDSDWREYTTRTDLPELSSKSVPLAALCVTRLAEILCADPDRHVVQLAAEALDGAIRNLLPALNSVDVTNPNASKGVLESLVEQSLDGPGTTRHGEIPANTPSISVKECLAYSVVALNGGSVAERCDACRTLLQGGWDVGVYLSAYLYSQISNPQWADYRSPIPTSLRNVSTTDAEMVECLLAKLNIGIKKMIDGLRKTPPRVIIWGSGESLPLNEELMNQTKQVVQETPELHQALQYLG
jgi:hypothetical protein